MQRVRSRAMSFSFPAKAVLFRALIARLGALTMAKCGRPASEHDG
jgi:hypothetical protein